MTFVTLIPSLCSYDNPAALNTIFTAAYDEIVLGDKTAQQSMDDVKPKIDAILAENA